MCPDPPNGAQSLWLDTCGTVQANGNAVELQTKWKVSYDLLFFCLLDAATLNVGTAMAAVLVPVWMAPLRSLMVWESHLTGTGYAGLRVGWGGSCALGNAEEEHKATEEKSINYCRNPQDALHTCEESVPCSATLHRWVFKQPGQRSNSEVFGLASRWTGDLEKNPENAGRGWWRQQRLHFCITEPGWRHSPVAIGKCWHFPTGPLREKLVLAPSKQDELPVFQTDTGMMGHQVEDGAADVKIRLPRKTLALEILPRAPHCRLLAAERPKVYFWGKSCRPRWEFPIHSGWLLQFGAKGVSSREYGMLVVAALIWGSNGQKLKKIGNTWVRV